MLELDDIQHLVLTRVPALAGRYEFLSFASGDGGRAWLSAMVDQVASAAAARRSVATERRWVTLAFTWTGLRALGVPEQSLATFPEEFRQGMAARAGILGDTGLAHPDHWVGGLAGDDLHAIAILFAVDDAERDRWVRAHDRLVADCAGVTVLSSLDVGAVPPLEYAHDHFGYRDRLSQPVIEGSGEQPTPGSGAPIKAGEFILGYPDEDGPPVELPRPEVLSRNGSYLAYRRLEEHVGRFRDFLAEHAETPEEQELLAAKLMGRWRSGAPLVLAPEKDDPELGADMKRNNDFDYKRTDPYGYAAPLGSHIRRMNPRDTAVNVRRRRLIRRGATYGPHLPDGVSDDGAERGIAAFVLCASLVRQFEFAQNVWVNDKTFRELGNERDPIIGNQDGTLEYKIPKRPIRRTIKGLPAFTTLRGGAYFFLPGLRALRYLCTRTDSEVAP
ncbi:Dyp-type peroxidase family [Nocardia amikacinitolerans]|uniref:Dyp-type peroxidase family n=1 Tax=Nocardia amikacinitolerans TaxID=756689 RepID=A0A285L137_9NOCA|nr:peroxidase [Nocardia amikacinitolerans]SNY77346.1 Dyp-type peroxidase family [Nocardia amikacinitolerans]